MTEPKDLATRRFLKTIAGGAVALVASPLLAQQKAAEFRAVNPPQPTDAPGKVEVLEFFWYGCPHCNSLEPMLKDWAAKLPADVSFRKIHVGLGPSWVPHQQLFYTLESMGKADSLGSVVFNAIHVERNMLSRPEAMADLLAKHGVDRKLFTDTYQSFAVRTRMRKASAVAEAYGLDGVPAFGVNGKWFTSPSMAGGNAQALRVLEQLIERERRGAR
ncbi:thiol:disulfide interchange protein DsbA/DsbL [Quisquiliibacterium transsilvanicum]|uniref:Thiol:disulfide interchange protein DsbA n=1 Tax=Quisquiliibacterium transsilvanicum TaxID=1549638 RepID=A0A7W8HIB1_9BURK|nr:thiol:disulfide interchange protein DsbA/DsbL [Quisquiliibacterium transsilvanicum]MBB5272567.1 thiol:disulfide interchange protein DsbA [Quisquiliibacterium transsilvanicum]